MESSVPRSAEDRNALWHQSGLWPKETHLAFAQKLLTCAVAVEQSGSQCSGDYCLGAGEKQSPKVKRVGVSSVFTGFAHEAIRLVKTECYLTVSGRWWGNGVQVRASPFLWLWNRKDDFTDIVCTSLFPQVTRNSSVTAISVLHPQILRFVPRNSHFITDFTRLIMRRNTVIIFYVRRIQKNVFYFKSITFLYNGN